MKRLLIAMVVVALIAAGLFVFRQALSPEEEVTAQGIDDTPVIAGTSEISAEAQVAPRYFTTLSFREGGRVASILVKEGDRVQAGDPLLRLETIDRENAVRQAEAAVTQAAAAVTEAEASLSVAQAQLSSAEAGVDQAEGGVSSAHAQQALQEAQPEPDDEDVAVAQERIAAVAVEQAEMAVTQAEAGVSQAEANISRAEAALERAQAGLTQAEVTREAAEVALAQATLYAAFEGQVADILIKPGMVVAPGTPIIVLADFSEWLVETTDLTELDVVDVAVGDPVQVEIDALPEETFAGTIVDVDRVSSITRGDVTYRVTVLLDETASQVPLRWGMTAFVNVDIE